jgi:hypothetical protein
MKTRKMFSISLAPLKIVLRDFPIFKRKVFVSMVLIPQEVCFQATPLLKYSEKFPCS